MAAKLGLMQDVPVTSITVEITTGASIFDSPNDFSEFNSFGLLLDSLPSDWNASWRDALNVANKGVEDLAGDTDAVWADFGPKAWKLGRDFPKGSTKRFDLDMRDFPPIRVAQEWARMEESRCNVPTTEACRIRHARRKPSARKFGTAAVGQRRVSWCGRKGQRCC
jgi:hypothetical protein